MKGIILSEFIDMVEGDFSPEIADQIIDQSDLESGGSYTRVGLYDYHELLQLVTHLSGVTNIPVDNLVETFGRYMAGRFVEMYPLFFEETDSVFTFLAGVDNHIHREVLKLYPYAELPKFNIDYNDGCMTMEYSSSRPFSALARGLLHGCIEYFGEELLVREEDLSNGMGNHTCFQIMAK